MKKLFSIIALFVIGFLFNTDKSDIVSDQSFGFGPDTAHADALPPPPDPDGG